MPTSATGNNGDAGFTPLWRSAEHGFTLVELMVVIAIIAVASALVVFAIPDPRGRLADEAARFAARADAVRDDAIVESRDMRLWVTHDGYGVERRRHGAWQPLADPPFAPVRWTDGTGALVGASGRAVAAFDATGAVAEPLTVELVRGGERASVTIAGNGAARVH